MKNERLSKVLEFIDSEDKLADVGCDHGYLAMMAINKGVKFVQLIDNKNGPLMRAKQNLKPYEKKCQVLYSLSSGISNLESCIDTVAICGMGGELIAQIVEKSAYAKKHGVRLVLQPMTSVKELREYLQNGFFTVAENVVYEDEKLYQIICVEYDGIKREYSTAELELGIKNIENGGEMFNMLLLSLIAKKEKKLNGLKIGGYDTKETEKEINELKRLIKGN